MGYLECASDYCSIELDEPLKYMCIAIKEVMNNSGFCIVKKTMSPLECKIMGSKGYYGKEKYTGLCLNEYMLAETT